MPFPLLCVENCELCFVLQMILKSSVNSRCHPDLWQSERHEEPDEDIAQRAKKNYLTYFRSHSIPQNIFTINLTSEGSI